MGMHGKLPHNYITNVERVKSPFLPFWPYENFEICVVDHHGPPTVFLSYQTEQHELYRLVSDQLQHPAHYNTLVRHFLAKISVIFCHILST